MSVQRFRLRVSLAIGAALALAAHSHGAMAQNYSVTVNPTLNGLDVKIEPFSNPGMLVVNLTNNTAQKVRCDLNFHADPQVPFRTFSFVDPGKTESTVFRATEQWMEVEVDVKCDVDRK